MNPETTQSINGEIRQGDVVISIPDNMLSCFIGEVNAIEKLETPEHNTDIVYVNFKIYRHPPWEQNNVMDYLMAAFDLNEIDDYDKLPLENIAMTPDLLLRITDLDEDKINDLMCDYEGAVAYCQNILGNYFEYNEKHKELIKQLNADLFVPYEEKLKGQLIDRLNTNMADYRETMLDMDKNDIIEMAGNINATMQAHAYMTNHYDYDEDEMEFLLEFQNPLEAVADAWSERETGHMSLELSDLSYVLNELFDKRGDYLDMYPKMSDIGEVVGGAADELVEDNSELGMAKDNVAGSGVADIGVGTDIGTDVITPAASTEHVIASETGASHVIASKSSAAHEQSRYTLLGESLTNESRLYAKMSEEYNQFLEELKHLPPEEIINKAHDIAFMEDILLCIENGELNDNEAQALLSHEFPLKALYIDWGHTEVSYMDRLEDVINDHVQCLLSEAKNTKDGPQRFMDVDIIDFLGKIFEKVNIHHPSDWPLDIKELYKIAGSPNFENKRLIWNVSKYGTGLFEGHEVFVKDTPAHKQWISYIPDKTDVFGYFVEITDRVGDALMGNVYEVGNFAEYVKHVEGSALPLHSISLTYSDEWGANAGKTLTVSRSEYEANRQFYRKESGNVVNTHYHAEDDAKVVELLDNESSERMGLTVGIPEYHLNHISDRLAEARGSIEKVIAQSIAIHGSADKAAQSSAINESTSNAKNTPDKQICNSDVDVNGNGISAGNSNGTSVPAQTLAEKLDAAKVKVKAQDSQGANEPNNKSTDECISP